MSARELPVLNFAPFRKYPTRQDQQEFADERQVCQGCISGVCCLNEDAISLTSFDIFRLAAFFNMSPAEFMLNFTQDTFEGEDDWRRRRNNNPQNSTVTWLRRRTKFAESPCIFLKYIRQPDGTPRRICSIHDARPLSCREFYFTTCKSRGTGELAALLAEGFEKIRDGEITKALVEAQLARFKKHDFETATFAESMEYSFWVEMKCALNMDQANIEGSNSYEMADYQDPIDEKLNRALSAKYLRYEEGFGLKPHGEQLMPYTSGLSFANSPEYQRIMKVLREPPTSGLFALGSYPLYMGVRTLVPGVRHAEVFQSIPAPEIEAFLRKISPRQLFPEHALPEVRRITQRSVYAAVLKGYNHLIRFASYVAALDPILEFDPPGTIEREIFSLLVSFETSLNPYIAHNPYFEPIKQRMGQAAIVLLEEELADATSPEEVFDCLRSLSAFQVTKARLSPELQTRIETLRRAVQAKLKRERPDIYMDGSNPIEARRAAGKRLTGKAGAEAWEDWCQQIIDVRHAAEAGFGRSHLAGFYRRTIDYLEQLPFRSSYGLYLYDVVKCLAHSMTAEYRISYIEMSYRAAAARLARYAIRLFDFMEERTLENLDCEVIAELPMVYRGLGLSYNQDPSFGLITHRLLESQLPDGSWETNPTPEHLPDGQDDYFRILYRVTWACLDGLRPLRGDILNPENAHLKLDS